jgi:anti-anti-sigma regulatory factor
MPIRIDEERAGQALQEALDTLNSAAGEVVLDFSLVHRIDANALGAMEKLAEAAKDKAAKVVLRGVNVDVYRVLKLTKLAPRFSFAA